MRDGQTAQARPVYCQRCHNPRPLGMLARDTFSWRVQGRTVVVTGGTITVTWERCGKDQTITLDSIPD